MLVHFWGTRGSLPASVLPHHIERKIRMALSAAVDAGLSRHDDIDAFVEEKLSFDIRGSYGCNTSCVEIRGGDAPILCDAGTGLRDFGNHIMAMGDDRPRRFHIFMSHLHWDHIHGFPFFVPAFVPGHEVHLYGYHEHLESAFERQQEPISFPLTLSDLAANIEFHPLDIYTPIDIEGVRVTGYPQHHPGGSYGYRFEKDGRSVVYSTDSEHQEGSEDPDYPYLDFIRDADLLVFDAQYNLADHFHTKATWGHSSNMMGIELAVQAGVKRLCLFHNEHSVDDHALEAFLAKSRRYLELYAPDAPLRVDLSYDGLEVDLSAPA